MKINFSEILGAVLGGAAANVVEGVLPNSTDANGYTAIAIEAVGGAAINALTRNTVIKGVGSGMLGVAGYKLAEKMTSETTTPATSGVGRIYRRRPKVGLLPSQDAIQGVDKPQNVQ